MGAAQAAKPHPDPFGNASRLAPPHDNSSQGPLADARPRYFTDPRTGQQAIAAVVPIRGLAAGEHELRLALAPSTSKRAPRESAAYRLVFWR